MGYLLPKTRTVYVSSTYTFDSETGIVTLDNAQAILVSDLAANLSSYIDYYANFHQSTNSYKLGVDSSSNFSNFYKITSGSTLSSETDKSRIPFSIKYTLDPNSIDLITVGNGVSTNKLSNAYTLSRKGEGWFAGDVYVGSTSGTNRDEGSKKLATEESLNTKMDSIDPVGTGSFSMNRKANTTIGKNSVALGYNTTASGTYSMAEGNGASATGMYAHAEGWGSVASGEYGAHAEGRTSKASGETSHAEGAFTQATARCAHAEGNATYAFGKSSHAEGEGVIAIGQCAHAEGGPGNGWQTTISGEANATTYTIDNSTYKENLLGQVICYNNIYAQITAYDPETQQATVSTTLSADSALDNATCSIQLNMVWGNFSHGEGINTVAAGEAAHTEGIHTIAFGYASHAEGNETMAFGANSHVQGKYNIGDTSNIYAHIIGNGTKEEKRSNAHTLDWDGNAWYAGDVYVGSTSGINKDGGSKKLATEEFVNTILN